MLLCEPNGRVRCDILVINGMFGCQARFLHIEGFLTWMYIFHFVCVCFSPTGALVVSIFVVLASYLFVVACYPGEKGVREMEREGEEERE